VLWWQLILVEWQLILVEWQLMKKKLVECNGIHYFLFNFILQMISQSLEFYLDWKPRFIQWGCCMMLSLGGMVARAKTSL
jgi:hypothetical protein